MTTPFYPEHPTPHPHDRVIEDIRRNGPGRTPADASAARPHTPEGTWSEMGNQFARGLGESGLQTIEALGQFSDLLSGRAALPEPLTATGMVRQAFANTRQEMTEFYGTPKTDEGHFANIVGNLVGQTAVGGFVEGVAGPARAAAAARRTAAAKYRLIPRDSYNDSFMIQNRSGVPEATLHGEYFPEHNEFYVDYVGSYRGTHLGANALGPKATRDILHQLQDVYPDLKYISGERITGVRGRAYADALKKGAAPPDLNVRVPIPPRQELMPTLRRLGDKLKKKLGRVDPSSAPTDFERELEVIHENSALSHTQHSDAVARGVAAWERSQREMLDLMNTNPTQLRELMGGTRLPEPPGVTLTPEATLPNRPTVARPKGFMSNERGFISVGRGSEQALENFQTQQFMINMQLPPEMSNNSHMLNFLKQAKQAFGKAPLPEAVQRGVGPLETLATAAAATALAPVVEPKVRRLLLAAIKRLRGERRP